MAWWSRAVVAVFSVLVMLAVAVSIPAAAQSPEARPGQPGWSRAASGCYVWNPDPQPGATVSWSGACENGRASGPGKLSWHYDSKVSRYEGEMRDGKAHGRGIVEMADGGRYEGEWRDGNEQGRGTWVWASGDRYDGEWRDDKRHGRGTFVRANGDRYDGEVSDGKQHGRGAWAGADGDRYDGEWREGLADGFGTFYFAGSDDTYTGLWRRGCFRDGDRLASFGVPLSSCP